MVTALVIEYFQRMMNAARPFATEQTYAISVCDRFIQGLDRRLLPCFRRMYPAHSTVHNMNGAYQCQQLPVILAAAQAAEDEVKGVQDIARGLLGQGFYSNVIGDDASAYPSQAEKTLSRYGDRRDDRTKGRERRPLECFGCGGNHSWMKDIVCPEPNQFAAPAACIQTFLNGAVGVRLPLPEQWAPGYLDDPETREII